MDDGSKSLEDSLAMLQMAADSGTTAIVASPHANADFPFNAALVASRLEDLRNRAPAGIEIIPGCDFHLSFENVEDALAHPTRYTINHLSYLLVEFPDFNIYPKTAEIFARLLDAGMTPVITHPERNTILQQRIDDLAAWVAQGALIQITAQSFLGRFGNRARDFSVKLLKRGLVHCIASDAHDLQYRPPVLDTARAFLAEEYGEETAARLTLVNPGAIIKGEALASEPSGSDKKWYRFWA